MVVVEEGGAEEDGVGLLAFGDGSAVFHQPVLGEVFGP